MWQSFVEIDVSWNASEQLFKNREEAIAWLKKEEATTQHGN